MGQEVKSLTKRLRQTRPDQTRRDDCRPTSLHPRFTLQEPKTNKPRMQVLHRSKSTNILYQLMPCTTHDLFVLLPRPFGLGKRKIYEHVQTPGLAPGNLIFKHACCSTQVMYIWDTVQRISNPSHRQDELSSFLLNLAEHLVLGLLYRQLL